MNDSVDAFVHKNAIFVDKLLKGMPPSPTLHATFRVIGQNEKME